MTLASFLTFLSFFTRFFQLLPFTPLSTAMPCGCGQACTHEDPCLALCTGLSSLTGGLCFDVTVTSTDSVL